MIGPIWTPRRAQRTAWGILGGVGVLFAALLGASVGNYTDVVLAKVLADISVDFEPEVEPDGSSYDLNATVHLRLNLTVEDPSPRALRLWLVQIKTWVRDYAGEDGVDSSRLARDDRVTIPVDGGTEDRLYFPVFSVEESYMTTPVLVGRHSNATFELTYRLNRTFPSVVGPVAAIYQDATERKDLDPAQVDWWAMVRVLLMVDGVPRDYSGFGDSYLLTLPLVVRQDGSDIGS